jgi:hypothetical protein
MKKIVLLGLLLSLVICACHSVDSQEKISEEITKTFSKKEVVNINFISGDCKIVKSDNENITVTVNYKLSNKDSFEPQMNESANSLALNEHYKGNASGEVKWKIALPAGTKVNFNSASGDFQMNNISSEINLNTASGDIAIENSDGNMKMNTASGDIKVNNSDGNLKFSTASGDVVINNSKGVFKLNTASGDVVASGISLTDKSSFNTASGDVKVSLYASPEFDITMNTASGDVVLNYNGNPISGRFELSVKKNGGDIVAPFSFDNESEKTHKITMKTVTIGKDTPLIKMSTLSGNIIINK